MGIKRNTASQKIKDNHFVIGSKVGSQCSNCGSSLRIVDCTNGNYRVWCPGCGRRAVEHPNKLSAIAEFNNR